MSSKSLLLEGGQGNSGERAADQISANTLLTFASKESDAMTSAMENVFSKNCCYILVKKQFLFIFSFTFQNPNDFHCYSISVDFMLTCGSVV